MRFFFEQLYYIVIIFPARHEKSSPGRGERRGEATKRRAADMLSVFLILWWFYLFRSLWFILDHQIEELPQC